LNASINNSELSLHASLGALQSPSDQLQHAPAEGTLTFGSGALTNLSLDVRGEWDAGSFPVADQSTEGGSSEVNLHRNNIRSIASSPVIGGGGRFMAYTGADSGNGDDGADDFDGTKSDDVDDDLNVSYEGSSDFIRGGVASLDNSFDVFDENDDDEIVDDYLDPYLGEDLMGSMLEPRLGTDLGFDIQQAIIESLQENAPLNESPNSFPQKILTEEAITHTFFRLKVILSELAGMTFTHDSSDGSITKQLIWSEVQNSLASGFSLFFDASEYSELLISLIKAPADFAHIFPGLVQGLIEGLQREKTNLQSVDFAVLLRPHLAVSHEHERTHIGEITLSLKHVIDFFEYFRSQISNENKQLLERDEEIIVRSHELRLSLIVVAHSLLLVVIDAINDQEFDEDAFSKLMDAVATTTLESLQFCLSNRSSSKNYIQTSLFTTLYPVLLQVFSRAVKIDPKRSPTCPLLFVPFLSKLVIDITSIMSLHDIVEESILVDIKHFLNEVAVILADASVQQGLIAYILRHTISSTRSLAAGIDWTALAAFSSPKEIPGCPPSSSSTELLSHFRSLINVDSYLGLSSHLSPRDLAVNLARGLKSDRINFTDSRNPFGSDARLTKVFSVLVQTMASTDFIVILQSKNLESVTALECRTDDKTKDIFALINSSLRGTGLEDMKDIFFGLFSSIFTSLSFDFKWFDDPEYYPTLVNCMLQTYEIIALVMYFMPDYAESEPSNFSVRTGILFGRIRSISTVGMTPIDKIFHVTPEEAKNSSHLANMLLASFNAKKSLLTRVLAASDSIFIEPSAFVRCLCLGAEATQPQSPSPSILELSRSLHLVLLLQSSIPILPIAHAMIEEKICLASLCLFFDDLIYTISSFELYGLESFCTRFESSLSRFRKFFVASSNPKIPLYSIVAEINETVEKLLSEFDKKLALIATTSVPDITFLILLLKLEYNVVNLLEEYVEISRDFIRSLIFPPLCVKQILSSLHNVDDTMFSSKNSLKAVISSFKTVSI
jgi:hypothetical protein